LIDARFFFLTDPPFFSIYARFLLDVLRYQFHRLLLSSTSSTKPITGSSISFSKQIGLLIGMTTIEGRNEEIEQEKEEEGK
jgi:hypothetical protein